jgi:hypothetical protein
VECHCVEAEGRTTLGERVPWHAWSGSRPAAALPLALGERRTWHPKLGLQPHALLLHHRRTGAQGVSETGRWRALQRPISMGGRATAGATDAQDPSSADPQQQLPAPPRALPGTGVETHRHASCRKDVESRVLGGRRAGAGAGSVRRVRQHVARRHAARRRRTTPCWLLDRLLGLVT